MWSLNSCHFYYSLSLEFSIASITPYSTVLIKAGVPYCCNPFLYTKKHPNRTHRFPQAFSRKIVTVLCHKHSTKTVIHHCKTLKKKEETVNVSAELRLHLKWGKYLFNFQAFRFKWMFDFSQTGNTVKSKRLFFHKKLKNGAACRVYVILCREVIL